MVQLRQLHARLCNAAASAALCSILFSGGSPAGAYVYLEEDIADASVNLERSARTLADSAYPILKSLSAGTLSPLDAALADVIRAADPDQISKSVALGRVAFESVPETTTSSLWSGLTLDACSPVPVPSAMLSAIDGPAADALKPLPKSDDAICLPPLDRLEKAASAVAAADPAKLNAFGEQVRATWQGAGKRAGLQKMGELNGRLIGVMQATVVSSNSDKHTKTSPSTP